MTFRFSTSKFGVTLSEAPFIVPVTEDFPPGKVIGVRFTENVVLGKALGAGGGAAGGVAVCANPAKVSARQRNARVSDFFIVIFSLVKWVCGLSACGC